MSALWRKSSYSANGGQSCVEVGQAPAAAVLVRDTVDRNFGTLTITAQAWQKFIDGIK